jgi:hypothetical protein
MKKTIYFATGILIYAVCSLGKLQIPSPGKTSRVPLGKLSPESNNNKSCFPKNELLYNRLFPSEETKDIEGLKNLQPFINQKP